jgi:protein SCO1/2
VTNPHAYVIAGLSGVLLLAGCSGSATEAPKSSGEKVYDVKGKVVAVNSEKSEVTLDHEDIPGLMRAMKMPFTVSDPKLLQGLQAGDQVQGKVKKDASGYTLTQLEKK